MSKAKTIDKSQDFNTFHVKLKAHDERAWVQLNFVLKRILLKWLNRKNIIPEHAFEIYCNTIAVFIEKFKELQFENFSGLKSYVFSIAEYKVKEFYRYDSKRRKFDTLDKIPESNYILLMSETDNEKTKEIIQKIHKLFNNLSNIEKNVMMLIYKEEKSHTETAELLGINNGNLRVIKYRALEKLKKWYAKNDQ